MSSFRFCRRQVARSKHIPTMSGGLTEPGKFPWVRASEFKRPRKVLPGASSWILRVAWRGLLVREEMTRAAQMLRSRCFELSSCSISAWRLLSSRMRSAQSLSFTSAKWTDAPSGKSRSDRTTGKMRWRNGHCIAGFAKMGRLKERMFCCSRTTPDRSGRGGLSS